MASTSPKLLLVCHTERASEVCHELASHGVEEPSVGAGGDETLELFEELAPDVVIVVAGLGAGGDLPSLAAAMRSGHYGRPSPIVLVASQEEASRIAEVSGKNVFDAVVQFPLVSGELATAVSKCSDKATGARINAAMDIAIESFVLEAMESLSAASEQPSESSRDDGDGDGDGERNVASWRQVTELAHSSRREPTEVLADTSSSGDLSAASKALLDEVLPGETLEVDLDELDSLSASSVHVAEKYSDPAEVPSPRGGGDFARQLRRKMSAMAERLFPEQGPGERREVIAAPSTAHTEIDLGAIAEDESEELVEDGSISGVTAGLGDSEITMAQELGSGIGSSSLTSPRATGSGAGQPLVGAIDCADNDVASVLARLWRRDFSGCLVLVRQGEEKRVHFEKGRVVFASSTREADRMGELLLRQGKINLEQLDLCREQVRSSGRRLGEVLVDQGHLKPRELLPAVRQHLEDIVYSVFSWADGTYDALPEHSIDERIRLSRHPAALIVEGIRRKYDRRRLESCLGGMGQVLLNVQGDVPLSVVAAADLSGPESAAQSLFDGEHSLEDASEESALESLRVAQIAHAWLCLGLAELVEHRPSDPGRDRSAAAGHLVGETDIAIDRQRVRAKYLLVQEADYFQLLGVRQDASAFEIQRAYEAAQRQFAFDHFPTTLQQELASELADIAEIVEEAYQVLRDDRIRSKYRENLR